MEQSVASRISAARRRRDTPPEVRRLLRQYDDARARARSYRRELRRHRTTHRDVFSAANRLHERVCHFRRREQTLRSCIGYMSIPGVPLAKRYRLTTSDEDDE